MRRVERTGSLPTWRARVLSNINTIVEAMHTRGRRRRPVGGAMGAQCRSTSPPGRTRTRPAGANEPGRPPCAGAIGCYPSGQGCRKSVERSSKSCSHSRNTSPGASQRAGDATGFRTVWPVDATFWSVGSSTSPTCAGEPSVLASGRSARTGRSTNDWPAAPDEGGASAMNRL